jgi:hypothetical protein
MLKYKILLKLYVPSWCVDTLCVGHISHSESSVHDHESFKINNPLVYQIWVSPYGSIVFFVYMSVCICFCTYLRAFHYQGFFASGRTHLLSFVF